MVAVEPDGELSPATAPVPVPAADVATAMAVEVLGEPKLDEGKPMLDVGDGEARLF